MSGSLEDMGDAALVVAVGRWQSDALAEIHHRHAGSVYALAKRVLRDPDDAEEVVQEVFLRLWNSPEKFDPERGSLRSYLLALCHGRSVDRLRAEASRRRREERDVRATPQIAYDVEGRALQRADAARVQAAMSTLPTEERNAIELAYFVGHTYREVATLLNAPEGTVKSRIRAGLRRLQTSLADAGVAGAWSE